MTLTRSAEYDAFGPWILPVTDLDGVPRVFRDYPFDFASADLVLKLPRDIARRDATPDMHLYDRMLIVDATGITVLVRDGDVFAVTGISADAIAAVETGSELLDGWLTVFGIDGSRIEVPYNGTSRAVMSTVAERLIDLAGGSGGSWHEPQALELQALGESDVALVNAYNELRDSGFELLATYPGFSPRSKESLLARILKGRVRLSTAIICGNDRQLVVLSRRAWLTYRGKPDLSMRSLVVVRSRVTSVESSAHPLVHDVTDVMMHAGKAVLRCAVPNDSQAFAALTA